MYAHCAYDAGFGQRSSLSASTLPATNSDLALLAVLLAAYFFSEARGFLALTIKTAERTQAARRSNPAAQI